jgi:hypothetical protein
MMVGSHRPACPFLGVKSLKLTTALCNPNIHYRPSYAALESMTLMQDISCQCPPNSGPRIQVIIEERHSLAWRFTRKQPNTCFCLLLNDLGKVLTHQTSVALCHLQVQVCSIKSHHPPAMAKQLSLLKRKHMCAILHEVECPGVPSCVLELTTRDRCTKDPADNIDPMCHTARCICYSQSAD